MEHRQSLFSGDVDEPGLSLRFTPGVMPELDLQPNVRHVYVDMNHWINLSKARLGRAGMEAYEPVLERLRAGVKAGELSIPLSAAHYEEMTGISDPKQRADIALTMDRLARYSVIADRAILMRHQLLVALAAWRGMKWADLEKDVLWGRGFSFAFGHGPGGMAVRGQALARERFLAQGLPLVKRIERFVGDRWTFAERGRGGSDVPARALWESSEYAMLRGPKDEDLEALREDGYAPERWSKGIDEITAREQDLSRILKEEGKKQLDDIVAARLWYWELNAPAGWAADQLGIDPDAILASGAANMTKLLRGMPMMAVEFALRRANWANGDYTWSRNDIFDLAHLGVAVPYCDITWTEQHASSVLNAAHVPDRLGTRVVARPQDLLTALG